MRPRRFREYSHSVHGLESIWCDSFIIDSGIHLRLIFPPSIIDRNGRGDRDVCPLSFGSENMRFLARTYLCFSVYGLPILVENARIARS
jgi:hypothetical protein